SPPRQLLEALLFFFSSRRRHTRFSRDWSSDVCSSDLKAQARVDELAVALLKVPEDDLTACRQFIYAGLSLLPVYPEAVRGDHRGTCSDPVFPEVIRGQSLDGEKLLCNLLRCQYVALQVLDEPGIVYRDALKTPEPRSEDTGVDGLPRCSE